MSKALGVHPSPVPARALAVADTGDGSAALSLGLALAQACLQAGKPPFVVLSAFGSAPLPPPSALTLRVASLGVREGGDVAAFVHTHADVPGPWICVGVPTLRGLVGPLRMLVAGAQSRTNEQHEAAGDEALDLILRAPRLSVAKPLIATWLALAPT